MFLFIGRAVGLELVVQRGRGLSILGGHQNPTGSRPQHPAMVVVVKKRRKCVTDGSHPGFWAAPVVWGLDPERLGGPSKRSLVLCSPPVEVGEQESEWREISECGTSKFSTAER